MAKRKKSASPSSSHKKNFAREPHAPKTSRARWPALIAVAGVAALGALYLFSSSSKKEIATSSPARRALPALVDEKKAEPVFEDFAGAEACAECHREQYDLWKNSTHGKAGGPPSAQTVISPFNRAALQFKDATVTAVAREQKYRFIIQQKNFAERSFEVKAVIGGGHMQGGGTQSYFAEFPDGTLRFLPFDFIRQEAAWFGETKDRRGWLPVNRELALTDLSEWPPTRVLGSANHLTNCQECHGSQIETKYDLQAKRYRTRYQTLAINCESCHGPGKQHVTLAKSGGIANATDIGMQPLTTLSKDQSLQVCFQCHALKDALKPGYLPGKNLLEYYALKFPVLGENPYHADGRIRAFGYQQNHLFSDCYRNGSMTCGDCHDPHAQTYRDANGSRLASRFDNGQCTSCHPSKASSLAQHTHHHANSPGSQCVACHMPYLQHQAMGKQLRFVRSDHTIPIPRPEFDAALGIENACSKCHADKTVAWLQTKTSEWYGELKPHPAPVSGLIKARALKDRRAVAELVLKDDEAHATAQGAGLCFFIENFLSPNMTSLEPQIIAQLKRLSEHEDIDLRALAMMSLHFAHGENAEMRSFLIEHLQKEQHESLLRDRWVLALSHLAGVYRERNALDEARVTYEKALELQPEAAAVHFNLGLTYNQQGNYARAIAAFEKALALAPNDPVTLVNLGIARRRNGEAQLAIAAYQQAIAAHPHHALAYFNLGNVFYENGETAQAIAAYEKATELDPSLSEGHFFLARAYLKSKQAEPALRALRAGLHYAPEDEEARKMAQDLEAYLSHRR
jgi:tetratricopeptide (TPR) repeat protein